MVINVDELNLDWVLWTVLGIGVGVLLAAVAIALVAVRLGGRRFGTASISLALVIAIAVPVDIVVTRRTLSGEATGWDLLWAVGLTGVGAWCWRRLFSDGRRSIDRGQ